VSPHPSPGAADYPGPALLSRWLRWAHRRRALVLAGAFLLLLGTLPLLARLSFDSNVLNLLPQHGPAVSAFRTYLEAFGSLDRLYVVFDAPDGQFVADHSDRIDGFLDELRRAPEVRRVDAGPADADEQWGYLLDHALLLLGPEGVGEALERFESPGLVRQLAHARELATLASPDLRALVRQDPLGLTALLRAHLGDSASALAVDPSRGGYVTGDGRSRLVIVEPAGPPYDTAFSRRLMARLDGIEARVLARPAGDSDPRDRLVVLTAGAYRAALETEALIRSEGIFNASVSLAAVLTVAFVVFRSVRVVLAGAVPLLLAGAITAALSAQWWPLSTAASGCAAMLFGVGIDGMLLMYIRYLEERGRGLDAEDAAAGLSPTVVSMWLGFATTAATYFGLVAIDFPSLNEVGRLLGTAVLVSALLATAIVPALVPRRLKPRQARSLATPWLWGLVTRHRRAILWSAAAATILLAAAAPALRVVPTLQKLQPQTSATLVEREIFSRFAVPGDAIIVLAQGPDLDALLEHHDAVAARLADRAPGLRVSSPAAFVPTLARQRETRRAVRAAGLSAPVVADRLAREAERAGFRPEVFRAFIDRLPRLVDGEAPISYEGYRDQGLTDLIGRFVAAGPEGWTTALYAYPRTSGDRRLVEEAVRGAGRPVRMTSVAMVDRELTETFAPQFLLGGLIGSLAVVALIYAGFRSARDTALSVLPTLVALVWTAGVLALAGVELDLFSVFALLMCVGVGVDYSIHLLHRHAGTPGRPIVEPLVHVAPAILLAWATTAIGFGTLMTSSYAPLRSLGLVSVVMLSGCLVASLVVLPAWLLRSERQSDDAAGAAAGAPRPAPAPGGSSARQKNAGGQNETRPPLDPSMSICVVVAAFNEAPAIGAVVAGARRHVPDVVVVDDGSTDDTARRAEGAGAVVLRHGRNLGKGTAVRTGLAYVLDRAFTHALLMDGDGQHDPDDIPALVEAARRGSGDLVLGERPFVRGTVPPSRFYTNTISSAVISRFFIGARVADAQSGFRLIRASLLRDVRLTGRGYEIETEMLIKLRRRGARLDRAAVRLRYGGARSKLRPVRDTTRTCFLAVRYRFFPMRWA
jgi:predicted RND superfamily exporter protein